MLSLWKLAAGAGAAAAGRSQPPARGRAALASAVFASPGDHSCSCQRGGFSDDCRCCRWPWTEIFTAWRTLQEAISSNEGSAITCEAAIWRSCEQQPNWTAGIGL